MTSDFLADDSCNRTSYLRSDFQSGKATRTPRPSYHPHIPPHTQSLSISPPLAASVEMLRSRQSSVSSLLRSTTSPTLPGAPSSSSTCLPLPSLPGSSTGSRQSSTSAPRRRPHADRLRHETAAGPSFDSFLSTSKGASGRQGEVLRAKVQVR